MDTVIKKISGRAVPVPGDDIDTDRIIPARFMRGITFDDLGEHVFHDERFDADGNPKSHPFNDSRYNGAHIVLAAKNFGCGSSREHAPQALKRFGINALIGVSFADIFAGNCVSLGMPAVRVSSDDIAELMNVVELRPETTIEIDLEKKTITADGRSYNLEMDEPFRRAFLLGLWDTTSVLLGNLDAIHATARKLPYIADFKPVASPIS